MTKTQLEYVLAIAKERSFRRAADSCFVTQPTLSAQVQKLEEELGVILFDRSKSPVRPTRVGDLVIEQAQRANDEFMRIKDIADEEKGSVKGDLTIAAIPTISPYLMPEILAPLRLKYPDLNLNIYELTTENALAALASEEVDVAFLATKEDPKKFKQEEIGIESMFLYARKGDPIGNSKEIKISDIKLDSLWLLEEGHCLRDEILDACKLQKEKNLRPQNMILKREAFKP
jgi:LysR family hydrogen peroxide-inducible transcriptional activator